MAIILSKKNNFTHSSEEFAQNGTPVFVSRLTILELMKFEGFVKHPYKPKGEKHTGTLTIGFGTQVLNNMPHLYDDATLKKYFTITYEQGLRLSLKHIQQVEEYLSYRGLSANSLPYGVYCALVDFCYNVGTGVIFNKRTQISKAFHAFLGFENCTQMELIERRVYLCDILRKYIYSGKRVLQGLVRRAEWRCKLVNSLSHMGIVYVPSIVTDELVNALVSSYVSYIPR